MSTKVPCYLRALRLKWGLTQEELAGLLPRASRARVSRVERGIEPPNAGEILAYTLIFGFPAEAIFPRFRVEVDDEAMRRALKLYVELERRERDEDPFVRRKLRLLHRMQKRASKRRRLIVRV